MPSKPITTYIWDATIPHTEAYLLKPLQQLISATRSQAPLLVLDLGCGNGALFLWLSVQGYAVQGIDPSRSAIDHARQACPHVPMSQTTASPAELARLELPPIDLVISTEVVDHCYAPREWAVSAFEALRPGGWLICSTPYHGYLKNLLLAASGQLDSHLTALWDGGQIKFWSRNTLYTLLQEVGFVELRFQGEGRFLWLWKSMLIAARRP
jgi:2-polyprenyl-3-methyl-5-hydroxy-6-metoxy-1,4-benzoquinol methylase